MLLHKTWPGCWSCGCVAWRGPCWPSHTCWAPEPQGGIFCDVAVRSGRCNGTWSLSSTAARGVASAPKLPPRLAGLGGAGSSQCLVSPEVSLRAGQHSLSLLHSSSFKFCICLDEFCVRGFRWADWFGARCFGTDNQRFLIRVNQMAVGVFPVAEAVVSQICFTLPSINAAFGESASALFMPGPFASAPLPSPSCCLYEHLPSDPVQRYGRGCD